MKLDLNDELVWKGKAATKLCHLRKGTEKFKHSKIVFSYPIRHKHRGNNESSLRC